MQNPIVTPRAFFDRVVTPDCEDVFNTPSDVRLVFHACASLHHLKEWVFHAGNSGFAEQKDFNTDVNARCAVLSTVRELAVNAKHFPPSTAEVMTIGVSAATLPYGAGLYSASKFGKIEQGQVLAKTTRGRKEWVLPIVRQAYTFWQAEFHNKGW